ncbi:triose-phosphate isomerase [Alteribacter lacisalsi]|uniref:Triosephosphate isomerase n=2 Tax=Alteribacter lacisalsi TaxID=2045244 RepID=A0A2W0H8D4_9BACI|nr:triose-phosphate isomerase [Alteribacter lacisalsi]
MEQYIRSLVEKSVQGVLADGTVNESGRRGLVIGNWKMNMSIEEAALLFEGMKGEAPACDVAVCPPFPLLYPVKVMLAQFQDQIVLGAQNMHWADQGAHTGEVSASMLKELDCRYVILGHSERRQAGETDEEVNLKVKQALSEGLQPVLCVGETKEEREQGRSGEVVISQLHAGLDGVENVNSVVVAYEPVWAIGTGLAATPEQAQDVHRTIRQTLTNQFGDAAARVPLLYGGSVKADNALSLAVMDDIDGALVGGASLIAVEFKGVIDGFSRG